MDPAYALSLMCGFIVAVSAMFIKRATQEGAGIARTLFLTNVIFTAFMVPVALTQPEILETANWWAPIAAGVSAFLGGVFIMASIRTGDVSIQTPLMGTKVIFVATIWVCLLGVEIPLSWWIAVFLTFFGVMMLGIVDLFKKQTSFWGIFFALLSSLFFSITDIVAVVEAKKFGPLAFIISMVGVMMLCSFALIPFFRGGFTNIPKTGWKWMSIGAVTIAFQHMVLLLTLSYYGKPTAVNIMYSSRGFWSIFLVWFLGGVFGNVERNIGKAAMIRRLIGTILITAAIVIVLGE